MRFTDLSPSATHEVISWLALHVCVPNGGLREEYLFIAETVFRFPRLSMNAVLIKMLYAEALWQGPVIFSVLSCFPSLFIFFCFHAVVYCVVLSYRSLSSFLSECFSFVLVLGPSVM